MVERNGPAMGDPLVELIRRLHDNSANDGQEISVDNAAGLLDECKFDGELRGRILEDFHLHASPTKHTMQTEEFIRRVKETETHHGKAKASASMDTMGSGHWRDLRVPEPVIANPGLFSGAGRAEVAEENPWKRTMSRLEVGIREGGVAETKLDVDCVMVNIHELAGTLFRHVNYKVQVSYGTNYGGGQETFVNSVILRRYSDFSWLQAYLCSKYIFRPVAPIPPKQLSAPTEAAELELARKRLPGLQAFLVACLQHPVFAGDATVRAFLTEPGSFADWRVSSAEADISEEQAIAQRPDLDGEAMGETQPLSDDPLFDDASASLESLRLYTEGLIEATSAILHSTTASCIGANEIADSLKDADVMLPTHKADLDTAFQRLAETSRNMQSRADVLNAKVIRRLIILHVMILGLKDCIGRLTTSTFTDFPGLARQLVALQGEISKSQLRDGPSVQSAHQLSLISQSQRLQRLYNHQLHRNEWAAMTVKKEIEAFMCRHMKELLNAVTDLSIALQ